MTGRGPEGSPGTGGGLFLHLDDGHMGVFANNALSLILNWFYTFIYVVLF